MTLLLTGSVELQRCEFHYFGIVMAYLFPTWLLNIYKLSTPEMADFELLNLGS